VGAAGAAGGGGAWPTLAGGARPNIVPLSPCGGRLATGAGPCEGDPASGGAAGVGAGGVAGRELGPGAAAAPKPSIVLLKSGWGDGLKSGWGDGLKSGGGDGACRAGGHAADAGEIDVGGGGLAAGGGPAGLAGAAGRAITIIVRVPSAGAAVTAPHCPQNCACSGSGCPHWLHERVFIDPVPVKVTV
jgi:hypothetical protein